MVMKPVTGLNVFVSGATAVALSRQKKCGLPSYSYIYICPSRLTFDGSITSPFLLPLIGGILAGVNLTLFIFAALPASGGHINPLITLGSFAIRASSLPRTLIYIAMQTLGATAGASLLHAAVGKTAIASVSRVAAIHHPRSQLTVELTDVDPRLYMEPRSRHDAPAGAGAGVGCLRRPALGLVRRRP